MVPMLSSPGARRAATKVSRKSRLFRSLTENHRGEWLGTGGLNSQTHSLNLNDVDRVRRCDFLRYSFCEVQLPPVVSTKTDGSHQGHEAFLILPEIFSTHVQRSATTLIGAAIGEIMNRVEGIGDTTTTG